MVVRRVLPVLALVALGWEWSPRATGPGLPDRDPRWRADLDRLAEARRQIELRGDDDDRAAMERLWRLAEGPARLCGEGRAVTGDVQHLRQLADEAEAIAARSSPR
jgi:hypothetical protein